MAWHNSRNNKNDFTYLTLMTHCCMSALGLRSRSPCANASSHHPIANSSQLHRKVMVKMTKVKRHLRSTRVVNTSCRNLACSRMFLCAKLHAPPLAMKRALFTRSLNTGLRGIRDTSAGTENSSGMILFRGNIIWSCQFRWSKRNGSLKVHHNCQTRNKTLTSIPHLLQLCLTKLRYSASIIL